MRNSKVYIALLHYPMYNKRRDIITTSVTNLDLHDIARVARTYDVEGFFIAHPCDNQHQLIRDILAYWQEGYGGQYNPDRKEAFELLKVERSLEDVIGAIQAESGQRPLVVATDARRYPQNISYRDLKARLFANNEVYLILFGTGWGIQQEIVEQCDYILEPVEPERIYNHLSVRSAVSIILDRLLGEFWYNN
ncbi:RNA methyltransferase [Syntrophomonas erecta]